MKYVQIAQAMFLVTIGIVPAAGIHLLMSLVILVLNVVKMLKTIGKYAPIVVKRFDKQMFLQYTGRVYNKQVNRTTMGAALVARYS